MSKSNEMYKMYNEMIKGYKEKQDGLFEHGVRCWMDLQPENPFNPEDPAFEQFFLMQKGYTLWMMGGADRKINRRRMLDAAHSLCELNPKRPYKFDKKTEEAELAEKAAKEKEAAELAAKRKAEELAAKEEAERIAREAAKAVSSSKNIEPSVEKKKADSKKIVLGVLPDEDEKDTDDVEENNKKKKSLLDRIFNR